MIYICASLCTVRASFSVLEVNYIERIYQILGYIRRNNQNTVFAGTKFHISVFKNNFFQSKWCRNCKRFLYVLIDGINPIEWR